MKKILAVTIVLAVGLLAYYATHSSKTGPSASAGKNEPDNSVAINRTNKRTEPTVAASFQAKNPGDVSGPIASRAAAPAMVATNGEMDLPPQTVLENIRSAIRLYGATFGGNPVGTNPEITAELTGKNPKQINCIGNGNGVRVDDQGEMVDSWGTPFFFHQISGIETEIRSAGPDKKMWTRDDLVTK